MNKLNLGNDLYIKGRIGWRGLSKDEYLESSRYKIINATALMDRYVDWENCGYISQERYEESDEIMLQEGDILISKDGTLGKIGYVKNLTMPCTVASGIFVLRNTIPERLDFDYLYHVLKSSIFKGFIDRNKASGSTINHLYQRDLENFELDLPNIQIQNKIAKILNSLDAKIENNYKISSELESMVKTIYDYWFLQFEFPNEEGKPYKSSGGKMIWNEELKREIPELFQVKKMIDIVDVRDGTHDSPKYIPEGKYLITSKHLTKDGIDFSQASHITDGDFELINQRSKVDKGDILFSMIGAIGIVYKIDEDDINFAIKNVALYKSSSDKNLIDYLFMTLKSVLMDTYIISTLAGSIQKFMSLGSLRNMPIVYHEKTIKNYHEKTCSIFKKMEQIKKENQELISLRDFLLPLLMNGQVGFKN